MLPLAVSWQTAPICSSQTGQTEREVGGSIDGASLFAHLGHWRPFERRGGLMNRAGMIGNHERLASPAKAVSVPGYQAAVRSPA